MDAALRQDAMAPVRDTANHLHVAGAASNRVVAVVAGGAPVLVVAEVLVEAVLEVSAYLVPLVAVRVA